MPVYPIIYSHLLIYSGTYAFYEIDCWFGNPFALSFICLLGCIHPSVHCIAATDWRLGTTLVAACRLLPNRTIPRVSWPLTIHNLTTLTALAFHGDVYDCRVLEHHQSKMTKKDISYTDRETSCKTDVREYSLIYLRYTDKSLFSNFPQFPSKFFNEYNNYKISCSRGIICSSFVFVFFSSRNYLCKTRLLHSDVVGLFWQC